MNNIIGRVLVELRAESKKFKKDLETAANESKSTLATVGKSAGHMAASIAVKALAEATAVVTAVSKKSTELYAEYEQSIGGVETLFKDAADEVIANSERAFETAGISANEYLEQATTFSATLIRNLGGDTKRAAELTDMAIQDMADNVNKLGNDAEMVKNAYMGLARGNATMLDNLRIGYAGTQKEALQLAKDMGIVGEEIESFADLGFDKSIEAIHELQTRLEITGTTTYEAFNTIQGSTKMAKASISDFVRGLADPNADLEKLFDNMMTGVTAWGENIGKTLVRLLPNITKALKMIMNKLTEALPGLVEEIVPLFSDTILDVMAVIMDNSDKILDSAWKAILYIVTSLSQRLPQLLGGITKTIVSVFTAIAQPENLQLLLNAALELFMGLVRAIPVFITELAKALPTIILAIVDFFEDPQTWILLGQGFLMCLGALIDVIPDLFNGLVEAFGDLFSRIWTKLKDTFTSFAANFGRGIGNILIGAMNAVIGFIEDVLNGPINAINGMLDALNSLPGVNISKLNNITLGRIEYLATGGVVNKATPAIIGEAGAEAVIPLERDNGWAKAIAGQLATAFESEEIGGGRTINIYMTNTIDNKLDIDEVSRELVTSIRRAI